MLWFGCLNVRLVKELVATFVAWFAVVNAIALVTLLAMTCRSTMDSFGIATLLPLLSLTAFMDASPASTRVKSATLQVLHNRFLVVRRPPKNSQHPPDCCAQCSIDITRVVPHAYLYY